MCPQRLDRLDFDVADAAIERCLDGGGGILLAKVKGDLARELDIVEILRAMEEVGIVREPPEGVSQSVRNKVENEKHLKCLNSNLTPLSASAHLILNTHISEHCLCLFFT